MIESHHNKGDKTLPLFHSKVSSVNIVFALLNTSFTCKNISAINSSRELNFPYLVSSMRADMNAT